MSYKETFFPFLFVLLCHPTSSLPHLWIDSRQPLSAHLNLASVSLHSACMRSRGRRMLPPSSHARVACLHRYGLAHASHVRLAHASCHHLFSCHHMSMRDWETEQHSGSVGRADLVDLRERSHPKSYLQYILRGAALFHSFYNQTSMKVGWNGSILIPLLN